MHRLLVQVIMQEAVEIVELLSFGGHGAKVLVEGNVESRLDPLERIVQFGLSHASISSNSAKTLAMSVSLAGMKEKCGLLRTLVMPTGSAPTPGACSQSVAV